MQVFEVRGISGAVMVFLTILALVGFTVVLPSVVMVVAWNTTVFETFGGPAISWLQGGLLWSMILIALKVIFNPTLDFKVQHLGGKPKE